MERGKYAGGTYRVIRSLGEGGTASVYLAVHRRTCGLFALKEIPLRGHWPRGELDYARHLSHPGLPAIHDLFEENGYAYVVMDYIAGITLKELKIRRGTFLERELLDWMMQLAEILAYLHSRIPPLIHGDIKPSNLMLDHEGRLVLLDFGACLVEGRPKMGRYGTCLYASPEQLLGNEELDVRSDFYSLGKSFRFLSGGVESRGLRRILNRCCMEDREARFLSDRELLRCLRRVQKKGRRCCLAFSVLAFSLLSFGSLRMFYWQRADQEKQYQFFLESNQTNQLVSAINSFPDREEAYQKLLQLDLMDQDFSLEESRTLEQLMAEHEGTLQGEPYAAFCYDLGIAYWYYFHDQGGKGYARIWFEKAMNGPLEEEMAERAEIYRTLGEYCEKKARRELTGEGNFSWESFFDSMEGICGAEKDLKKNGQELKKRLQEELLSLIYESLPEFQKAGIKRARVENLLAELYALSPDTLKNQFNLTEESLNSIYGEEKE